MTTRHGMIVVYKAEPSRAQAWAEIFRAEAPEHDFRIWPDTGDPAEVNCLIAWEPPGDLANAFPNLQILISVGAGADQFDLGALPPDLPLVRMIEPGISEGISAFASMAVLALHRDLPDYIALQRQAIWEPLPVHAAQERRVGFLGAGTLARACIDRLRPFGFPLATWSRNRHDIAQVVSSAGEAELEAFLSKTDILVCLLPLTDQTRGLLDSRLFAAMPKGSALVHAGRGAQLVAEDLIAALDANHLRSAFVDVTDPEPLPPQHALWQHPKVIVTPHIASVTRPETAARVVLDNLRRFAAGAPLIGLIDRQKGY